MPVQIPTLQRAPVQDPQRPVLLDNRVPDLTDSMRSREKGIDRLGEVAVDTVEKVKAAAGDTEGIKRAMAYEQEWRRNMYGNDQDGTLGIKFQQGDPTTLYKGFDDHMTGKFKDLTEDENLDPTTRAIVMKHLSDKANSLELQKLAEYGHQQNKYDNDVHDAAVSMEKNNLNDAATLIKVDSPDSFAAFDQSISRIRDLRLRQGLKTGAVVPDENGKSFFVGDDGKPIKVSIVPHMDYALKKDLSDGIHDVLDNLVKSNQMEKAKALNDKYGDYLLPDNKRQLAHEFQAGEVKDEAFKAVEAVRGKSPNQIDSYFEKLSPEAKDKAYEILNDQQRRQEDIKERTSKRNYNALANHVLDVMNSDKPYAGKTELEQDPQFINRINLIADPKQRKAIYDAVIQPKESSDAAIMTLQKAVFNGELQGMSPEDFNEHKSGLSKVDRRKWDTLYEKLNRPQTGAQVNAQFKIAGDELQKQLIDTGYIHRNDFGKLSNSEEMRMLDARNEFIDALSKRDEPMSTPEINQFAREFALSKKKGEAFSPPEVRKFVGQRNKTTPPPVAPQGALIKGKTRPEWNRLLQQKLGKAPSAQELDQFIKEQE
jgi:ribosomal protein L22